MIDCEELREYLIQECLGGFFVGGFGEGLIVISDIEHASPEKIIEIAKKQGINLKKFEK